LIPILTDFFKAYPDIDVRLVLSDRIINLVEDHVDVALRTGLRTGIRAGWRVGSGLHDQNPRTMARRHCGGDANSQLRRLDT
jgi:DNA-binding transcriptional LysR family regulator